MINGIYCEFLKLKKTFIYPVLLFIAGSNFFSMNMNEEFLEKVGWDLYLSTKELTNFNLIFVFTFAIIIGYVVSKEFSNNTASYLYSYPLGRFKIFLCKFIFIMLLVISVYALNLVASILGGLLFLSQPLTSEVLLFHIKLNLISMAFQIALVPVTIFLALLSRNLIVPFIYSIIILGCNMMYLLKGDLYENIPFILPMLPINKLMEDSQQLNLVTTENILLAIVTFLISLTACTYYYKKADIY